jgi:hypothetical protein
MPLTTYFRALLLIYTVLVFGELASGPMTLDTLPDAVRKYAEDQWEQGPPSETADALMLVSFGALVLMFISLSGLWLLWRPARMLFTVYLLLLAIGLVLAGPVVESALTSVLAFMNTTISGLILGMLYFSPLRHYFDKTTDASGSAAA